MLLVAGDDRVSPVVISFLLFAAELHIANDMYHQHDKNISFTICSPQSTLVYKLNWNLDSSASPASNYVDAFRKCSVHV